MIFKARTSSDGWHFIDEIDEVTKLQSKDVVSQDKHMHVISSGELFAIGSAEIVNLAGSPDSFCSYAIIIRRDDFKQLVIFRKDAFLMNDDGKTIERI